MLIFRNRMFIRNQYYLTWQLPISGRYQVNFQILLINIRRFLLRQIANLPVVKGGIVNAYWRVI